MYAKVRPTQTYSLFSPASQAFWISRTLSMLLPFPRMLSPPTLLADAHSSQEVQLKHLSHSL